MNFARKTAQTSEEAFMSIAARLASIVAPAKRSGLPGLLEWRKNRREERERLAAERAKEKQILTDSLPTLALWTGAVGLAALEERDPSIDGRPEAWAVEFTEKLRWSEELSKRAAAALAAPDAPWESALSDAWACAVRFNAAEEARLSPREAKRKAAQRERKAARVPAWAQEALAFQSACRDSVCLLRTASPDMPLRLVCATPLSQGELPSPACNRLALRKEGELIACAIEEALEAAPKQKNGCAANASGLGAHDEAAVAPAPTRKARRL
jgi:hypothetical protein